MQFLEEEILEITEATWGAMMGLDILPKNAIYPVPTGYENILVGQVNISGGWDGQVRLHATAALGRATSAKMFEMDPEIIQAQDQIDAIYELTNIIGGNIKSLLPEPCRLSLPTVQLGSEWAPHVDGADQVSELAFECEGHPLLVTVWKNREH